MADKEEKPGGQAPDPKAQGGDPPAPGASAAAAAESPPAEQRADSGSADSGAGGAEGNEAGGSAAGETPPQPLAAQEPKKEDWREAKIRRLTAQLHELRDKQPAAETPRAPDPGAPSPEVRLQEAEIERRAQELARQNNAIDTFNRMCREAATQGRQQFPDFDTRISALRGALGGSPEDVQQQIIYNQFVSAALETGKAPELLHQLGGDLDEAARIMGLPLVKMTVELTRLAGKAPDTSTTRAPKPLVPIGARGAQHTEIDPTDPDRADSLSTKEWMTRRNAQEKAQFDARGRR